MRRKLLRATIAVLTSCLSLWITKQAALRLLPFDRAPYYPRPSTILEDRRGTELAAFVAQDDSWSLPLTSDEISPALKLAVVAVEDRRFTSHHGIDWYSAAGAAWQDLRSLRAQRGASTLTMQVIRLRDHQTHGWSDKIAQAFQAEQLELHASKSDILTEYLNRAPFGGNLVGAGAASWRYFGKSCRDLSLGQAALLAGLPQSPNRFRPDKSPDLARARRAHVLDQMLAIHAITPDDLARANAEPIDAAWRLLPQQTTQNAWGGLPTLAELAAAHPGTRLRSTLDAAVQQTAWRALNDQWPTLSAVGIDSGAVVIVDVPSGNILAAVSRSSVSPGIDLSQAPRSTGSVLKPFIFAAAFDLGILTPQTEVLDSPKAWAGYVPSNFDRDFRGNMPAADALAESRNIPAMTVLAKVGIDPTLALLAQLGICTPIRSARPYGLSLAIGGAEASPREIAEAYATLARGGEHLPLRLVAEPPQSAPRILPQTTCWQTLACLSKRPRTESITGASDAAALDAAWKTGTSNGLRDAWCVAATPRRTVVVWLGNAAGHGSPALVGQEVAAPLALKLIAMIDSSGGVSGGKVAWPVPPESPQPQRVLAGNMRLSVVSPAPGTEILAMSDGPAPAGAGAGGGAGAALKCAGGVGHRRWWFANGQLVAVTQGQTAWWNPDVGSYELRVVDESGAGAVVRVSVR